MKLTLENSRKSFDYIGKNELHVKSIRAVWKGFEVASKMVRAYQEETGWDEESTIRRIQNHS